MIDAYVQLAMRLFWLPFKLAGRALLAALTRPRRPAPRRW